MSRPSPQALLLALLACGCSGSDPAPAPAAQAPAPEAELRARIVELEGQLAEERSQRLQREQVNLAMVRERVATDDDPLLVRQRAQCRSLRDALDAIPGAAPAEAGATTGAPDGAG